MKSKNNPRLWSCLQYILFYAREDPLFYCKEGLIELGSHGNALPVQTHNFIIHHPYLSRQNIVYVLSPLSSLHAPLFH